MSSMRRVRRAALRQKETAELNITAFMNLMVVLVPFLLVMAVFSRITILELNLPAGASAGTPPRQTLSLEVVVRRDGILVQDRNSGPLRKLPALADGKLDLKGLTAYLLKVKEQYPQKLDVTLLLEPEIPYETVVQVMDRLRVAIESASSGKSSRRIELFPEISIGDAPVRKGGSRG